MINDWFDNGRMDRDYSIACYQQALQHLPADVREYGDAQDVIGRALTAAIARKGQSVSPTNSEKNKHNRKVGPIVSNNSGDPNDPNNPNEVGPTGDNGSGKSLFARAFDRLGPGNANSIPIPLIVLGSLALLLLAAGAAGVVARRLQERRPQPAPVRQRTTPDGPAV